MRRQLVANFQFLRGGNKIGTSSHDMETRDATDPQYDRALSFPKAGVGTILRKSFAEKYDQDQNFFRNTFRGNTLFVGSDYSGQHKSAKYDVYSIAIYDFENRQIWELGRNGIRKEFALGGRRMSFKKLNDRRRKMALVPFLRNAENLSGIFATFAVSKSGGSLFQRDGPIDDKISRLIEVWKPKVRERLLTAIHLVSFLLAGVSRPGQDVHWFTDEDEIAANDLQITNLTELFAIISSQYLPHTLRHMLCGSARSDTGSRDIEDFLALPDLIAGAACEILEKMYETGTVPIGTIIVPAPRNVSWKSQIILSWCCSRDVRSRLTIHLIDKGETTPVLRCKLLRLHGINDE